MASASSSFVGPLGGFNAVLMSEHFASFFVWIILHLVLLAGWVKATLPERAYSTAKALLLSSGLAAMGGLLALVISYVLRSPTLGWTGARPAPHRSYLVAMHEEVLGGGVGGRIATAGPSRRSRAPQASHAAAVHLKHVLSHTKTR